MNIELLYSPTYSSEYNPIERLWLLAKLIFRRLLVTAEINLKHEETLRRLIRRCIDESSTVTLCKHIKTCKKRM